MASSTQWTWVWANSRRQWGTEKPGVLRSLGSQRVRHDWVTEQQQQHWALVICPPVCGLTEPTHHSLTARPWSSQGFRKAHHQSLLQSAQPNIPWGSVPSGRGLGGSKGGALYCPVTGIAGQKPFAIRVSLILSSGVHHWSPPSDPNWGISFAVPQLCSHHLFALLPSTSLYSEESGSPLPPQPSLAVSLPRLPPSLWVNGGRTVRGVSWPCGPPGSYVVTKTYMDPPHGPDLVPYLSRLVKEIKSFHSCWEKRKWKSLSRVWLFATPWTIYSPWNSPGQNTRVGSLSLLQGIFPTQVSNPGLPHCGQILYQLSHKGRGKELRQREKPFDFERKIVMMRDNPIQVTLHISWAVTLFLSFEGLCDTSPSPIKACRNMGQLSPTLKRKWSSHYSQQKTPKCSTWMQSQKTTEWSLFISKANHSISQ